MFSGDPLIVKIQNGEKDGNNDLLLKIDGIIKCKLDSDTNHFTVILQ
jgi:hypothetical protein